MKATLILGTLGLFLIPSCLLTQEIDGPRYKTVLVTENSSYDTAQNGQEKKAIRDTTRVDESPLLVWEKKPEYPATALNDKAEGLVETQLYIDKQGAVSKVVIVQSSGREDLDNAAVEAARQYRFKPARLNGAPVSSMVMIPFQFRLTSSLSTIGSRIDKVTLPSIIIKEGDTGGEEVVAPKGSKKDGGPSFSKIVRPKYTEIAQMRHASGEVDVKVTIDEKGDVISVSSLSRVHDDLVHAALAAAAKCKFVPARRKGQPVESSAYITFLFGRDKPMTDKEWQESRAVEQVMPQRFKEVNPEKAGTSIAFKNDLSSTDTLVVLNLKGTKVRTVALGHFSAGPCEIVWDGKDDAGNDVEAGVYFYQVFATPDDGSKTMRYMGKVIIRR